MTRFGMESPNLYQTCSMGYSQLVLKMEVIDLDLQCHFGHLLWIWARIAKFATKNLHLGVLSAGIGKGGYWPWPSFRHFAPGFQETAFSIALVHWSTGPPRGVICPKRALVSSLHRSDVDENGLMWVHADRPNGLMAGVWGSTGIIWWHHNPCHNSTSKLNRSPGSNRGLGNLKCGVVQGDFTEAMVFLQPILFLDIWDLRPGATFIRALQLYWQRLNLWHASTGVMQKKAIGKVDKILQITRTPPVSLCAEFRVPNTVIAVFPIRRVFSTYFAYLSRYPGYLRDPHWFSMVPEISRVTWQVWLYSCVKPGCVADHCLNMPCTSGCHYVPDRTALVTITRSDNYTFRLRHLIPRLPLSLSLDPLVRTKWNDHLISVCERSGLYDFTTVSRGADFLITWPRPSMYIDIHIGSSIVYVI